MKPFPTPPIVEAVIYVNIEPVATFDVKTIEVFELARYPQKRPHFMFQTQFQTGPEPTSVSTQEVIGYAYESEDSKNIVQFRTNGFTCSQLAPYKDWSGLKQEAKIVWAEYLKLVGQPKLAQIGLRYVNRIEVKMPVGELSDWLKTYPNVGEQVGSDISNFFMQVQVPQTDISSVAVISQSILSGENSPAAVYIMLDIDVTQIHDVPQESDQLWSQFEILRERKNKVFAGCLTEKTMRLFE